jgi:hypothetical protein
MARQWNPTGLGRHQNFAYEPDRCRCQSRVYEEGYVWEACQPRRHAGDCLVSGSVANSRLAEWPPRRSFPNASDGLEVERVSYERNGFCKHRGANSESTFNDARLTVDIACEVEECRLTLA